ncbi:(d)CMP kinase [Patescibacteria group bacterium]|nr:(d)CMP kinase [Patescibacteria group bacterium]
MNLPSFSLRRGIQQIQDQVIAGLSNRSGFVVGIAGASGAGKSELAERLKQMLQAAEIGSVIISMDDFYRGAAELRKDRPESPDFDRPAAVDLKRMAIAIRALRAGQPTELPRYSLSQSETVGTRLIQPAPVIIVEGLYVLRKELAAEIDYRVFVEADIATILVRRMRRELDTEPDKMTEAKQPLAALRKVMKTVIPAYNRYIVPTRPTADLVVTNVYTLTEAFDATAYEVQDKLRLDDRQAAALEQKLGESESTVSYEDYFFSNEERAPFNHLIRVRLKNGRLYSVVYKGERTKREDGKIVRSAATLLEMKEGDGEVNLKEMTSLFHRSGFQMRARLSIERKLWQYEGIRIAMDEVPYLGPYLELRAQNALSRLPEIDRFKERFDLGGLPSVGPYADIYLARLNEDPQRVAQVEAVLNEDITRDLVIRKRLCRLVKSPEITQALARLRSGYPDKPATEQSRGRPFREACKIITDILADRSLAGNPDVTVTYVWRSGLAFGPSYRQRGVSRFYHFHARQDEKSLDIIIDTDWGELDTHRPVLVVDSILATGNTILPAIARMIEHGVPPGQIILVTVFAAPLGIARVKRAYPEIEIITASVADRLDYRGYVEPGVGEFADKYFSDFTPEDLHQLLSFFDLPPIIAAQLREQVGRQQIGEMLVKLVERDFQDAETAGRIRKELEAEGLALQKARRNLVIDTGLLHGAENVMKVIVSEMESLTDCRIIAVEGLSGVGKGTITKHLCAELSAHSFSLGEVFRYLAYRHLRQPEADFANIAARLRYRYSATGPALYDGDEEVSERLKSDLRAPEVDKLVPQVASQTQPLVIRIMARALAELRQSTEFTGAVVVEGRSFTLDFLPSDMRVKLIADPGIRAERRWNDLFREQLEAEAGVMR